MAPSSFAAFEAAHSRRTTRVVAPLMLLDAGTALVLCVERPGGVTAATAWAGVALVGVVWLSTFLLQVPQHRVLAQGFDDTAHRLLVGTNWVRTVAWTLRAGVALWMLARALPAPDR